MSEDFLSDITTPCTSEQMMNALGYAWQLLFNEVPEKESLSILLSQWALETGRGKYCHCWNIGNYKHVPGDGRDFTYFRCNEIISGHEVWYDPDNEKDKPYCCFRAYHTIEAGAIDYVTSLNKRFRRAWPDVVSGDPGMFAHDLKLQGYYTAAENDHIDPSTGKTVHGYKSNIISLFTEFCKLNYTPYQPDQGPVFSDSERNAILALVAITTNEILSHDLQPGTTNDESVPDPTV